MHNKVKNAITLKSLQSEFQRVLAFFEVASSSPIIPISQNFTSKSEKNYVSYKLKIFFENFLHDRFLLTICIVFFMRLCY